MRCSGRAVAATAIVLTIPLSGCGLFYENSYRGTSFRLYSDHSERFVEKVGGELERIYAGYSDLFGIELDALGTTTVLLDGDDREAGDGPAPSVLGYYVPFFNLIRVDARARWTRREDVRRQVLLHEVAHHFIVTEFSGANSACWLNEGLAGVLEVSLFDDDHFEHPLVNPTLYRVAQIAAYDDKEPVGIRELLDMRWGRFHSSEGKERHYALAWSLCYYLLEYYLPRDLPLGERIEALYRLDRDTLIALESNWKVFLRGFDLSGRLLALAARTEREAHLTARWAIDELRYPQPLTEGRVLRTLTDFFDDRDPVKRTRAYSAFLEILERGPSDRYLGDARVVAGLERIRQVLGRDGVSLRPATLSTDGPSIPAFPHPASLRDAPDAPAGSP